MRKTILPAALILGFVVSVPAQAQTLEKIKARNEVTLGVRDGSVPFSYLNDEQVAIGYSVDICLKIVDAIKTEQKLPNLKVSMVPVNASTQIPLIANSTVDLVCGVMTNNAERQKVVSYSPTTFVTSNSLLSKKSSNIKSIDDLKGKAVVSTAGSASIRILNELNKEKNLGMNILSARDQPEAFLTLESGRASAYVLDDVILATQRALSKAPNDYNLSSEPLSFDPYGIVFKKDDPVFKATVDRAVIGIMKSGELEKLYTKWFQAPIPPKGVNLNIPMSAALKKAIAMPTDSPDPNAYK